MEIIKNDHEIAPGHTILADIASALHMLLQLSFWYVETMFTRCFDALDISMTGDVLIRKCFPYYLLD